MRKNNTVFIFAVVLALSAVLSCAGIFVKRAKYERLMSDVAASIEKDTAAAQNEEESEYPMYTVIGDDFVSMKETASDDAEEVNKVYPGSIVEFMGDAADGYAYIRGKGSTVSGYVKKEFIQESDFIYSLAPLTVVDADSKTYSYDEMINDIAELDEKYESFSSEVIATTADGRDIFRLKIGDAPKKMLFYGALNGTDYMTSQLLMKQAEYYAHYMSEGLFGGYKYSDLFSNVCIEIIPMVNPDGVSISQWGVDIIHDEAMREVVNNTFYTDRNSGYSDKLKTEYYTYWKANANGIDLTKNFPDGFEEMNSRKSISLENHKGRTALSEIESKALAGVIEKSDYCVVIGYTAEGNCVSYIGDMEDDDEAKMHRAFANGIAAFTKYPCAVDSSAYTHYGSPLLYSVNKGMFAVEIGISGNEAPLDADDLQEPWIKLRELPALIAQQFLYVESE